MISQYTNRLIILFFILTSMISPAFTQDNHPEINYSEQEYFTIGRDTCRFLPFIRKSQLLKSMLFDERKIENHIREVKNPADEISFLLFRAIQQNPETDSQTALKNILTELYQPKDPSVLQYLADLFIKTENVYYDYATGKGEIISPEVLMADTHSPPVYLRDKMNRDGLTDYKKNLCILRRSFSGLKEKVGNTSRIELIIKCIDCVIDDINALTNSVTRCDIIHSKEIKKNDPEPKLKISVTYMKNVGSIKLVVVNPKPWHTAELRLWNLHGKLMNSSKITLLNGTTIIDVNEMELGSGFYFVEVDDPLFKKPEHLKLFVD
jgi:hypothetical protein